MEVFTKKGKKDIILKALIEYEENHYYPEDQKWQSAINVLIDEFRQTIKLYYHKTEGGAEYLCSECVDGTNEGSFKSEYVIRIDGDIKKDSELFISSK